MEFETSSTEYAPAEVAPKEVIERQTKYLSGLGFFCRLLDAIPDIMVILNEYRQIIFCNKTFMEMFGSNGRDSCCGMRPGEMLNCEHAFDRENGCGTTEFCEKCGAVNAILDSLKGKKRSDECRIIQLDSGEAMDLRVCATPFDVNGEKFAFFAVKDISHEKRRAALERIFFHDILNTVGGLLAYTTLLKEADPGEFDSYLQELSGIAQRVVEEIQSQRDLTAAENNDLSIHPARLISTAVLHDVALIYKTHEAKKDCSIRIVSDAWETEFSSDERLLNRIIGNMVKNALEASKDGETVTLGCRSEGEDIVFWVHNPGHMPRDVHLQIFQRSFSTKGTGRGLGTYSIRLLTERYLKGHVSFTTSPEDGTTFRIQIPRVIAD